LQCEHYELNNQLTTEVTKRSGICKFPHTSSRESRGITRLFAAKVAGQVPWDAKRIFVNARPKKGFKKRIGGMSEKKHFMVDLIMKGRSKEQVLRASHNQYPEMKKAYCQTLYYHAIHEAKKEKRVS
jgi:hypothetical protein